MGHRASTPHLTSIVGRDCPNSAGLNLEAQPTPTASSAMLAASPLPWQRQWDLLSNRGALAPRGWTGACPRSLSPRQRMPWMRRGTRSWIHNVPWGKTWFWLLQEES